MISRPLYPSLSFYPARHFDSKTAIALTFNPDIPLGRLQRYLRAGGAFSVIFAALRCQ